MKNMKVVVVFFSAVALLSLFVMNAGAGEDKVLEIKEKMFIQQCDDIYINTDEYVGKTIKLEGIYGEFPDFGGGDPEHYVYRNAPGCCGYDGMAGFRVLLNDGPAPKPNDWVEATGTVEMDTSGQSEKVFLRLSSLKVMGKRGAEFVEN